MAFDVDALDGARVLVAGAGATGVSVVRTLLAEHAEPTLVDARFAGLDDAQQDGVPASGPERFTAGDDFAGIDLVVTSPGFAPSNDLLTAAAHAGIPVWGDVELAWRLDRAGHAGEPRTWLVITGTNGKTTTTSMTETILDAAGVSGLACGNIGLTVLDALRTEPRADVLCVEMSSFQLHWAPSVRPHAGVVLNVAADHLDWHGSFEAYRDAKAQVLQGDVAVVGLDDEVASTLPAGPDSRRIGFTLGEPSSGQLGIAGGSLVDAAFADSLPLVPADRIHPPGPAGLSDALAAAALCRAIGVPAEAIDAGLTGFSPAAHRGQVVARIGEVDFVDDSKATNPHAAQSAIDGRRRVVLIAGGLLKGASVDELVTASADKLAGLVAIGADRDLIVESIARHAPQVPTVTVFTGDDGSVNIHRTDGAQVFPASSADSAYAVMSQAFASAWSLAQADGPGPDAVLLAPAAASLDMFAGYGARGDSFAAAARELAAAAER